jgi:uncharacterized repeat protein (TIGR03803 family)
LAIALLLGAIAAGPAQAQTYTFTTLHDFDGSDGQNPQGNLISDAEGNLYGTALYGGSSNCSLGCGTVFELVNSSGSYTEKVLYSFTGGSDGASPFADLIMDSSGNLYGTTEYGGDSAKGVVFELVNSSGTYTEKVLYSFTGGSDAGYPEADLILDSSGNLYGTTVGGGSSNCSFGCGTVFELANSSGSYTEKVLYSFTGGSDGAYPEAGLTLDSAGNLYGTTNGGGSDMRYGVVFELVNSSGSYTEKVLYSFTGGSDGAYPTADLIMDSSGNLYGTTVGGGTPGSGPGVVFELVNSSGSYTDTVLYSFTGGSDGAVPHARLMMDSSGNLYGTTGSGGSANCAGGCGTAFDLTKSAPFSALSAKLNIVSGPSGSFNLNAAFTLGSEATFEPGSQLVILQVGSYSVTVPAGSFKTLENGNKTGGWAYQALINGTTVAIQIVALGGDSYQFKATAEPVNFTGIENPVTVAITVGGNGGSTNVTATIK